MPFSLCQQDTKTFSLSMSLMRLWLISHLSGIRVSVIRASWNQMPCNLSRTIPPSLPSLFLWQGHMHPAARSGRGGARWREGEEEKRDRSIIQLMHFSLFMKHCKPDRWAANTQFIHSLTWDVPPSSVILSYFQGHTMHYQPAGSGDWVPKSFKGLFYVELEIIAAVQA